MATKASDTQPQKRVAVPVTVTFDDGTSVPVGGWLVETVPAFDATGAAVPGVEMFYYSLSTVKPMPESTHGD